MKCPQCNGDRMATYTSALTRFQPHSEPFESGVLEEIEEIETYVDVGVHHCLDCGHDLFWLEDPRSPLEAEVERLREALENARDWTINANDSARAAASGVSRVLDELNNALEPAP